MNKSLKTACALIAALLLTNGCGTPSDNSLIRWRTKVREEGLKYIEIDSVERNGNLGILVIFATQEQCYYLDEWLGTSAVSKIQQDLADRIRNSKRDKDSYFQVTSLHVIHPENNEEHVISGATLHFSSRYTQSTTEKYPFISGILKTNLGADIICKNTTRIDLNAQLIIKNEFANYKPHHFNRWPN